MREGSPRGMRLKGDLCPSYGMEIGLCGESVREPAAGEGFSRPYGTGRCMGRVFPGLTFAVRDAGDELDPGLFSRHPLRDAFAATRRQYLDAFAATDALPLPLSGSGPVQCAFPQGLKPQSFCLVFMYGLNPVSFKTFKLARSPYPSNLQAGALSFIAQFL